MRGHHEEKISAEGILDDMTPDDHELSVQIGEKNGGKECRSAALLTPMQSLR